jgi:hypothetical protein
MRLLMLAITLLVVSVGLAQDIPLIPYIVDHRVRQDSAANARFLLDGPAGRRGFITAREGHLPTPDGRGFRIWGVNVSGWTKGSALLPPHKDAEVMANELAREEGNCVRFQFLELLEVQRRARWRTTQQCRHGRLLESGWEIPIGDVAITTYLIKVVR